MTATVVKPFLLPVGKKAPDFKKVVASQSDSPISLSDYVGQFLIMVFYPKDSTPGCTRQLCALRDDFKLFEKLNTAIVGVNHGSLKSHENFSAKQGYNFPILVDEGLKIALAYGAVKENGTSIQRTVYVVGPDGKIVFAQHGMPADEEIAAAIKAVS